MKKSFLFVGLFILTVFMVQPVQAENCPTCGQHVPKYKSEYTVLGGTIGNVVFEEETKIEECSLEKTTKAEQGYECKVETKNGEATWLLHTKTESGKMVWKDLTSGLLVSDIFDGTYNHNQISDVCTEASSSEARGHLTALSWALPSKGDFKTLEANGVRKVIDTSGRWFWSSSVNPNNSFSAYYFNGNNGNIGDCYRGYNDGSALCASR